MEERKRYAQTELFTCVCMCVCLCENTNVGKMKYILVPTYDVKHVRKVLIAESLLNASYEIECVYSCNRT